MKYAKTFESWNASKEEHLDEFFGLGKLFKAMFGRVSEPVKKRLELFTKNIDTKTGEVTDAKELANDLTKTFKEIADDKKADLKGVDSVDTVKTVLKEFFTDIKGVFAAARVPFMAMVESKELPSLGGFKSVQIINEDLKTDFSALMTKASSDEFDKGLDSFVDAWVEKNGKDDPAKLEAAATKFIDTMMGAFEKKIAEFGPARLEKLVALTAKNPEPKAEEVKKVIDSTEDSKTEETVELKDGEEVESPSGHAQLVNAIVKALKAGEATMTKIKDKDTIVITGVKW